MFVPGWVVESSALTPHNEMITLVYWDEAGDRLTCRELPPYHWIVRWLPAAAIALVPIVMVIAIVARQ